MLSDFLWIPSVGSLACLWMMFNPYQRSGDYDFGAIFRILWLVPISIIWAVYFGFLTLTQGS